MWKRLQYAETVWEALFSVSLSLYVEGRFLFPKICKFTTPSFLVDEDIYIIVFWKHVHFYEWVAILQKNEAHNALDLEE